MLKEALRDIYAQARDRDHAHRMLVAWYQLVVDYGVAEFIRLARTLSQWEDQFLAYFETRLTNGRTEARNLVIKHVKRISVNRPSTPVAAGGPSVGFVGW